MALPQLLERRPAWAVGFLALILSTIGLGLMARPSNVSAQTPNCANATVTVNAESDGMLAFADTGETAIASFVCIVSAGFSGGQSAPLTADGSFADGCYFVDGIGTHLVAAFTESPDIKQCAPITQLRVGVTQLATATPTATATATATTPATSTPVATATPAPATPTTAPATATPVRTAPSAPSTGSGSDGGDAGSELPIALGAFVVLAMGGVAVYSLRRRAR